MPALEHTAGAAPPADGIAVHIEAMRAFWADRLDRLERLSERRPRRSAADTLRTLLSRINHLGEPGDPGTLVARDRRHIEAERERDAAISTYILMSG